MMHKKVIYKVNRVRNILQLYLLFPVFAVYGQTTDLDTFYVRYDQKEYIYNDSVSEREYLKRKLRTDLPDGHYVILGYYKQKKKEILGKITEITLIKGKYEGIFIERFFRGNTIITGFYFDGVKHGDYIEMDISGQYVAIRNIYTYDAGTLIKVQRIENWVDIRKR